MHIPETETFIYPFWKESLLLDVGFVTGRMSSSAGDSGYKMGDILDTGTDQSEHSYTHTHTRTTDNLEMAIRLQHMTLDWRRKLDYC